MKLRALLLMFLLLLPSSLWAAMTTVQNCAAREAMAQMECCCGHAQTPVEHHGPQLVRDCCCEAKAPILPSELPDGARLQQEQESPLAPMAMIEVVLGPPMAASGVVPHVAPPGPPRAPPRPLFLSFQRFLI